MMWKPRVVKDRERGGWRVVGGKRWGTWREAYESARRAAGRMAGREVPC